MSSETRAKKDRPWPPGERGFSLLELAVASMILAILLLFATQGLREGQRLFSAAERSLTRGSTELASTLIRRDAKSASNIEAVVTTWNDRPLVLSQPDGSKVAYLMRGNDLRRLAFDPTGAQRSELTVARRLLVFRWQRPIPGLLEAEIALRPPPRPPRVLDRSAVRAPEPSPLERVTVSLRSRPRSTW